MRRKIITAALAIGMLGAILAPGASAQVESMVTVTVIEGVGKVCNGVAGGSCGYDVDGDPLWSPHRLTNGSVEQGLYWPGVGPRALYSPVEFSAGPGFGPPDSVCVSTLNGPGCSIRAWATQSQAEARTHGVFPAASGLGAYCGSSHGRLTSTFNAARNPVTGQTYPQVTFDYRWEQSAATILPLVGTGTDGSTLIGFTSSRGLADTGDCGITKATTSFQVEGFTVSFRTTP